MWTAIQETMACRLASVAIEEHVKDIEPGSGLSLLLSRCQEQNEYPLLNEARASFVTLQKYGQLRGCIGSLQAYQPLAEDIAHNAVSAAVRDPRFAPVGIDELDFLEISISVLSPSEAFPVTSEQDLISRLQPGIDGLVLEFGHHRSTYLPSVWEQLPDPKNFVRELKMKAGLAGDFWHSDIQFSRYHVHYIECESGCGD